MSGDLEVAVAPTDVDENEYPLSEKEAEYEVIPTDQRGCTDLLWLVIFIAYVGGMALLTLLSLESGDPNRLIYGTDANGNLCGVGDFKDRKYVSYPRAEQDVLQSGVLTGDLSLESLAFYGVCVKECPLAGEFVCSDRAELAVAESMDTLSQSRYAVINACMTEWPFSGVSCSNSLIHSECWAVNLDTTNVFFRCLPQYTYIVEPVEEESGCVRFQNVTTATGGVKEICVVYRQVEKIIKEQPTSSNILFDTFNTWSQYASQMLSDVFKAIRPILVSGLGVSSGIGFLYVVSLWCCVGFVVWVTVFASILASIAFTLYCYVKAGIITTESLTNIYNSFIGVVEDVDTLIDDKLGDILQNENITIDLNLQNATAEGFPEAFAASIDYSTEYTYAAYGFTGFTVLLIIIVFGLFDRISRAIEIFEVASKAIRKNMMLVILPYFSMLFVIGFSGLWAYSTAYVVTAGDLSAQTLNRTFSLAANETVFEVKVFNGVSYGNLMMAYMFLGLLWVLNFANGITIMTTSGAVLQWFWADEVAKDSQEHSPFPILKAYYRTMRYHLGTIAFGSLVLAFIQFIRYLAAYLQRKMSNMGDKNKFLRYLFCAVQCFLKCVQKCIEFVSRSAYIFTAMYGTNFCVSTKSAFVAITSNIAQIALVTFLGEIIQRFGQVLITMLAGLFCWIWIDYDEQFQFGGENQLNSFVFPVLIAMILAWFASAEVLAVYDITVDTILLSYCQDKRLAQYKADHKRREHEGMDDFISKHELKDAKLIKQASMATIIN